MADKQYTKQQVIDLADEAYDRCCHCERYEPVWDYRSHNNNCLFNWSNSGCYYSYELPFSDAHWCWFDAPRDNEKADKIRSLTWNDLIENIKTTSR